MDGVNATVIDEDLEGAALIAGRGQDEEVTYDGLTAMLATCGAGGGVGGTAAGRLVALAATSALPVTPALAVVPLRAFSVNGMPFGGSGSGRFETGGTS